MRNRVLPVVALVVAASVQMLGCLNAVAQSATSRREVSDRKTHGFALPESVAYHVETNALYVGQFGSILQPSLADGKGKISKVSLKGEILEDRFLPAEGQVLHKPKGIWIRGNRLWIADIGCVWVFDIGTRRGRKLELSEANFPNDPVVMNGTLYVTDWYGRQIFRVNPADFLDVKGEPAVDLLATDLPFEPNGICAGRGGSLIVGTGSVWRPDGGLYEVGLDGSATALSKPIETLGAMGVWESNTTMCM